MSSFLTDGILQIILALGVIGIIFSQIISIIPGLSKYSLAFLVMSILTLSFGLFESGKRYASREWELKIAEMKQDKYITEAKSENITTKVVTEYIDKVKIVKEKGDVIIKKVPKYIVKHDDNCIIPNDFVKLYDYSTKNQIPNTTFESDGGTSDVKMSEVLENSVSNNTQYYDVAERLKSLQGWVREQEKLYDGGEQ